jgi:hypothetical protein
MASQSLVKLKDKILRLQHGTARAREKAGEVMETVINAGETVGASFAFGLWEGRTNDPKQFEIAGVPVPLALGIASHAFAMFGVGRGMEAHFRNIGNGALSAHLNGIGRKMGAEWKAKQVSAPTAARGELNAAPMRGVGITQADLAAYAQAL